MTEIVTGSRIRTRYGMTGVVTAILRVDGKAAAQVTLDQDTLVTSRSARFHNRPIATRNVECALSELSLDRRGSP